LPVIDRLPELIKAYQEEYDKPELKTPVRTLPMPSRVLLPTENNPQPEEDMATEQPPDGEQINH